MVKDLRTGVQRSDPETVLSGDIDEFLSASLAYKVSDKGAQPQADLD
jgi:peptide chain release factor 2